MRGVGDRAISESICREPLSWRQGNKTGAIKLEQHSAASHVFELSIGSAPISQTTKLLGQPGAAQHGLLLSTFVISSISTAVFLP